MKRKYVAIMSKEYIVVMCQKCKCIANIGCIMLLSLTKCNCVAIIGKKIEHVVYIGKMSKMFCYFIQFA